MCPPTLVLKLGDLNHTVIQPSYPAAVSNPNCAQNNLTLQNKCVYVAYVAILMMYKAYPNRIHANVTLPLLLLIIHAFFILRQCKGQLHTSTYSGKFN